MHKPVALIGAGLSSILGFTIAHEVGHVLGLQHAGIRRDGKGPIEIRYDECGLDLSYPQYDSTMPDRALDGFPASEWPGLINNMAQPNLQHVLHPLQISLFTGRYDETYSQIIECWKSRSAI